MDHTSAETNHNINSAFGPGTANGVEHGSGSRSFAKEMRALKMRSVVATIRSWQWPVESSHWRLSSYSDTVDYQGTQRWPFCGHSAFEANWEGALWADCRSKNCHIEASSSLTLCNNDLFLCQIVTCDKKWILYDNQWQPTQWLDQEEAPGHFPKQTCTRQSWSLVGGLLPNWSTTAFWIRVKPLQLRSMLGKLMRCSKNCNACSWYCWQNGPSSSAWLHSITHWTTNASKVERTGLQSFASSAIFTWSRYRLHLDSFLQGNHFHIQQEAENAFQKFFESWSMNFKKKLIYLF